MSDVQPIDTDRLLHKATEINQRIRSEMADQQYDNEMRGALFPEDKSRYRNPATAPDYTGYVQIDHKEYRLAGWVKNRRTGKVLSLAVSVRNTEQQSLDNDPTPAPVDPGDFLDVS